MHSAPRPRRKAIVRAVSVILLVLGLGTLFAGIASADSGDTPTKVYVCKYVGTPGVSERLQTGQNPIEVSINSIKDYQGPGSYFADAQGRSYVLATVPQVPEPTAADCPGGSQPPDTVTVTVHETQTITQQVPTTQTVTQVVPTTVLQDVPTTVTEQVPTTETVTDLVPVTVEVPTTVTQNETQTVTEQVPTTLYALVTQTVTKEVPTTVTERATVTDLLTQRVTGPVRLQQVTQTPPAQTVLKTVVSTVTDCAPSTKVVGGSLSYTGGGPLQQLMILGSVLAAVGVILLGVSARKKLGHHGG